MIKLIQKTMGQIWGWFVEHLCHTYVAKLSVTKIMRLKFINLVKPKAEHEHLFNKPASGYTCYAT
jgi:hypothetical protein